MTALCMLSGDWRGDLPPDGLMGEVKHDGWRALWLPDITGRWGLWTRNGHPIEGIAHIAHRLAQMELIADEPMMFDAEFQVAGTLAATKHWCESGWRRGGESGVLRLFDAITVAEWRAGGSDVPLYQRKARLAALFDAAAADEALSWEWRPGSRGADDPECVRLVPDEWVNDADDVRDAANRVWAAGGEGLMLKDPMAPYRRKRSDAWQKVKRENQHKWRIAA